jgi:methionyl-tRNA synthetase
LSFIRKNAGGVVPTPGAYTAADHALLDAAAALLARVRGDLADQGFHKALEAVFGVVSDANRYIDAQAPWTLRKTDPARMATVLYVLLETVRRVAMLLQPFMPGSMARQLDQLAVPGNARSFAAFDRALVAGTVLPEPTGIFPRYQEIAT